MEGVNIIIKHLSRRFLFTSRLLGSDISQSFPFFLSNPFPLPRTPSHKHTALSLFRCILFLSLSLPDQQRRRGQQAGEEEEEKEQEGRLSDSVVWVLGECRETAAVSTPHVVTPSEPTLDSTHQQSRSGRRLCLVHFCFPFSLVLVLGSDRMHDTTQRRETHYQHPGAHGH